VFSDFDYINLLCPKSTLNASTARRISAPTRCGVTLLRRKLLWFCTLCVTTTRPVGS
jgi:hypothetical protein